MSPISCCRLTVDENAPSLPERSLKRPGGRGRRGHQRAEKRPIVNNIRQTRIGGRRRGAAKEIEVESKTVEKEEETVTKRSHRFRPRAKSLITRQRSKPMVEQVSEDMEKDKNLPMIAEEIPERR